MLWMRVWSPGWGTTGWSIAMADGLLPLFVAVGEDLRDVVPALLHAHQTEAEIRDHVPDQVVRLVALGREQQHVAGARQAAAVVGVHPARVELVAHRAGAVRVLVGVG